MIMLAIYVVMALVFSFLCSIAEAVILSITTPYIALLEQENKPVGKVLRQLKEDINKPLAAILTLNTIAHTAGAAGAGAQAAVVFGSTYVGIASAILTLLILIFSEIIPKALGAHYWQVLAPMTAYVLKYLTIALFPFVKMAEKITGSMTTSSSLSGLSPDEFAVMAKLSAEEGKLAQQESKILQNLMSLGKTVVKEVMTPRTVVLSLPETMTVEAFFQKHEQCQFSRIPVYRGASDKVVGFVLKNDILLAQAKGDSHKTLKVYSRKISVVLEFLSLSRTFEEFLKNRSHIALVVNEYGDNKGVITLEDLLETILGEEIVDESDKDIDMQKLARSLNKKGSIDIDNDSIAKSK